MIKRVISYFLVFIIVAIATYFSHDYFLDNPKVVLRFSLLEIYIFHFFASFIISLGLILLSNTERWVNQIGFIYIFTFLTKLLFFVAIFKDSIFSIKSLTKIESLSLLIPVFIFLFFEAYIISRILNSK